MRKIENRNDLLEFVNDIYNNAKKADANSNNELHFGLSENGDEIVCRFDVMRGAYSGKVYWKNKMESHEYGWITLMGYFDEFAPSYPFYIVDTDAHYDWL